MLGEALALLGCVLVLLAAVGVARFPDVLTRMHALSKATTLGLLVVLIGAAIGVDTFNDVTSLLLAGALQVLTAPVGANLIARASYQSSEIPHRVDVVDELSSPDEPAPRW